MKKLFILLLSSFILFIGCAPKGFMYSKNNIFVHKKSGMRFPKNIENISRLKPYRYAPNNISVGYQLNNENCYATFTVYIYEHDTILKLEEEFINSEKAIEMYHEEHLVEEKEITLHQMNDSIQGKMAVYDLVSHAYGEPYFQSSYLYLFNYGKWFIKYRITFPDSYQKCAKKNMENFIASFKWSLN